MKTARRAALLTALVSVLAPAGASAATTRSCVSSPGHGITHVTAKNVGCAVASKVAQNHNYGKRTAGWRCRGKRLNSKRERVTCTKASRVVTFRSTYVMELPTAPAPPIAGAAR